MTVQVGRDGRPRQDVRGYGWDGVLVDVVERFADPLPKRGPHCNPDTIEILRCGHWLAICPGSESITARRRCLGCALGVPPVGARHVSSEPNGCVLA